MKTNQSVASRQSGPEKSSWINKFSTATTMAATVMLLTGIAVITQSELAADNTATERITKGPGKSGASVPSPSGANATPAIAPSAVNPAAAEPVRASKGQLAVYAKVEMPADFVPASVEGTTENAPFARLQFQEFSSGQRAIDLLAQDLTPVANWYGMTPDALRHLLLTDASVHLDRKGRILHIDEGTSAATGITAAGATVTAATSTTTVTPFPLDQTFKLHTRADSTRIMFLNFKGQGQNPAFDLDRIPSTFSDAERLLIQKAYLRVAEDYAAFDVDITTEPPVIPTTKIGVTILITPQTSTAGGYAYLNSFGKFAAGNAPAFCFPNNLNNNEKPIGECISHELGHTLGLSHQSTASTVYYGGQGAGDTGWAPIMGVSYYKNLSQWAKGEYAGANNKEDAYAVMSRQGLKPRTDDHGNTIALADAMTSKNANGLNNLSANGVIETPTDVDMFRFTAGAGPATLKVTPARLGGNLDITLQLMDASGKIVSSANPVDLLDATISVTLPLQGVYYLSVKGTGKGDPTKTGYSNYGSIGQYNIVGSAALAITTPPVALIKASTLTGTGPLTVTFDGSGSSVDGAKIAGYQWTFGDGSAAVAGATAKHIYTKAGSYDATLNVIDTRNGSVSKTVKIVVTPK
jgi:PKD repeat protein